MTIENSHDKRMVYDGGVYRRKIFNFDEINPIFLLLVLLTLNLWNHCIIQSKRSIYSYISTKDFIVSL